MAKKVKVPFREQISGIISKLAQIDQNSPDAIFMRYDAGAWSAYLYEGGFDSDKEAVELIEDDYIWATDKDRKAAYAKAVKYIKKNEGKSISLANLKTGDRVYFDKKKAIVGTIREGATDFSIVDTGETRSLLGFGKSETYFKTW